MNIFFNWLDGLGITEQLHIICAICISMLLAQLPLYYKQRRTEQKIKALSKLTKDLKNFNFDSTSGYGLLSFFKGLNLDSKSNKLLN